jgi:hypothetical protein
MFFLESYVNMFQYVVVEDSQSRIRDSDTDMPGQHARYDSTGTEETDRERVNA